LSQPEKRTAGANRCRPGVEHHYEKQRDHQRERILRDAHRIHDVVAGNRVHYIHSFRHLTEDGVHTVQVLRVARSGR